jgi:hypothetical protein
VKVILRDKEWEVADYSIFSDMSVGIPRHIDDVTLKDAEGNTFPDELTDDEWDDVAKVVWEMEQAEYEDYIELGGDDEFP